MSDARVIKATFSTWRPVNGRKVLQLIFEVPIEQQGEVLTMLGAPDDKWCAIALLKGKPELVTAPSSNGKTSDFESEDRGSTPRGAAKERTPFGSLPLVQQCVLRCQDERFQLYLRSHFATVWGTSDFGAAAQNIIAARVVRTICNVVSRAELGTDEKSAKEWRTLEDGYEQWSTDQKYAGVRR